MTAAIEPPPGGAAKTREEIGRGNVPRARRAPSDEHPRGWPTRTLAEAPLGPVPLIPLTTDAGAEPREVGSLPDEITFRAEVGRRLRALRTWDDLSQQQLATRAGVTRNFVSGVERGALSLDAWRLRLLTRALNVTSGFLLCETPDPFPPDSTGRPESAKKPNLKAGLT